MRAVIAKLKSGKRLLVIVVLLLALGGAGLSYVKYTELKKENARLSNPQEAAQREADRLKNEVGQLYELPNETPTIATVVDANKLKSQPFFANAQNDDRVLIFTQSKIAILYRPSTRKIVTVAPINIGNSGANAETNNTNNTSNPSN